MISLILFVAVSIIKITNQEGQGMCYFLTIFVTSTNRNSVWSIQVDSVTNPIWSKSWITNFYLGITIL